jgi:polyhydroxyalkanoate synthase
VGKPLELPPLLVGKDEELDAATRLALETDRLARAYAARATLGISPAALALAFGDWWLHLAASPGKLVELQRKAARKWRRSTRSTSTPIRT